MARTGVPRASYKYGDVQCITCKVWIRKEDIPKVTHLGNNNNGIYHNSCNYKLRLKGRVSPECAKINSAKLRDETNKATEFMGYALYPNTGNQRKKYLGIRKDILKNKERWESLSATPPRQELKIPVSLPCYHTLDHPLIVPRNSGQPSISSLAQTTPSEC